MKRYLILLLCLVTILSSMPASAAEPVLPPELPDDSWDQYTPLDPSSYVDPWRDESRVRTSGIFTYRIMDRTKKEAVLESVNTAVEELTVPAMLDGYKIVCVGIPDMATIARRPDDLPGKLKNTLRKLTISEGIQEITRAAFADCKKLTSLTLPKDLAVISYSAFSGCSSLKKVHIRESKYATGTVINDYAFSSCFLDQIRFDSVANTKAIPFQDSKIKKVVFSKIPGLRYQSMDIDRAQIGRIWVDPYILSFDFCSLGWEYLGGSLKKLIINGKKTKVRFWNKAHSLGALYTVPKAKCIKWAKKYKLTYKVKSCGKMGKVTYKNKKATWKKVKTSVRTYKYNASIRKWKSSSRSVKTYYKIYGKKTKKESYKLLKTTAKQSYKTKYKYLKVKPVATWS